MRILIIQGHPDPGEHHLNHLLADAYEAGAAEAGHEVRTLTLSGLDFPLLRSQHEWEKGAVPPSLTQAQQDILWAEHLVLFYPLWLGGMPALLKGFLEQVARPGFAFRYSARSPFGIKGLKGRSARIVVTMGMPATFYRWFYRAHSLKTLKRNILGFVGIAPVRTTIIGMTSKLSGDDIARLERRMRRLARSGR